MHHEIPMTIDMLLVKNNNCVSHISELPVIKLYILIQLIYFYNITLVFTLIRCSVNILNFVQYKR